MTEQEPDDDVAFKNLLGDVGPLLSLFGKRDGFDEMVRHECARVCTACLCVHTITHTFTHTHTHAHAHTRTHARTHTHTHAHTHTLFVRVHVCTCLSLCLCFDVCPTPAFAVLSHEM